MEKRTDKELMKLIADKNTHALKALYHRYEIQIFNFILRYTGSREIAQELIQETFTRIWFRADDMDRVNGMLFQLTNSMDLSVVPEAILSYKLVFSIMIFGYILHWLPQQWKDNWMNWFILIPHWLKIIIVVVLVFLIYQSQTSDLQPFIYFQF